jgi:hypothetical protein
MTKRVERADIEGKLREIKGGVDEAATNAKPAGISIAAAGLVGALGLAFIIGERKARKRTTVVEVRRV